MIENISSDIVSILIRYQTIDISEISVYQYGFEVLISSFLTCLIALVSGLITVLQLQETSGMAQLQLYTLTLLMRMEQQRVLE